MVARKYFKRCWRRSHHARDAVVAVNRYSKTQLPEKDLLLLEFHGSAESIAIDIAQAREVLGRYGGAGFLQTTDESERRKLWQARHDAGLACRSHQPGGRIFSTDVCVPIALNAAIATGLPVWFGMSARRAADGRVISFDQHQEIELGEITKLIPKSGVDVAGVMHTGAELISNSLDALRKDFAGPLSAYPDSGFFEMPDWRFVDVISPERLETFYTEWISHGAHSSQTKRANQLQALRSTQSARDLVRTSSRA